MTYNMTNVTESYNLYDTANAVNQLTGGYYAVFLLFVVFAISFISLKKAETEKAFIVASFITTIVGILLLFIGFIDLKVFMFPLILLVGSLIFELTQRD